MVSYNAHMDQDNTAQLLEQAVHTAGRTGYTGQFRALGKGEANSSYALAFENGEELVLRIASDPEAPWLRSEARSLGLLTIDRVPQLIFYDDASRLDGRRWILESLLPGQPVDRPTPAQLASLGALLAEVHRVRSPDATSLDAWQTFLTINNTHGDEAFLLNHPDSTLWPIMAAARTYCHDRQGLLGGVIPVLTHSDANPTNLLADGDLVGLIDWEYSKFSDPMVDFATIYYDDMEYNRGRGRMHITPEEKAALFGGYTDAGGTIDADRLLLWTVIDKLTCTLFLYWRIHEAPMPADEAQLEQYNLDLENLKQSLQMLLT